ncbi:MAG: hypothetical protein BGO69_11870 [Bacteroidetes bacterium 46-16]|jgi:hypothetical protein|nr:MAG: hypothetical protein BGO69_11870 [Bacteroidetes bacterium 46-16]
MAQGWQWGKRGGSSDNDVNNNNETVTDMATDKSGNIYVLSKVLQTDLNVDGHPKTNYGYWDIMISSFSCDGSYRWSKVIGADDQDYAYGIKTDTLGGVYIVGNLIIWGYTGHIDTDTTIPQSYKTIFLLKYDTAGIYKWFRMPQADTVTYLAATTTNVVDIDVDKNGDSYSFCVLPPGAYANGAFIVNSKGLYVLKYNAQGVFQSGTQLQISYSSSNGAEFYGSHFKHDHKSGRYYVAGTKSLGGTFSFNGNPITHSMYVGAFNNVGQYIWKRENTVLNRGFNAHPVIDDSGSIILTGDITANDNFNGYIATTSGATCPFVVKVDSNGNNQWAENANTNGTSYSFACALRSENEVAIAGSYPGKLLWQGAATVPNHDFNQGFDPFITTFNLHTGQILKVDTLGSSFGYNDEANAIAGDGRGNLYIGGYFSADLRIMHDTLQNIGGQSDFFIAKYGCNCTQTAASYVSTVNNAAHSADFTYNGSTPYDSLKWSFGDNNMAYTSNDTISHTYALPGTYQVCVTVYTACDSNTYCQTVQVAVGITNVMGMEQVSVYPNPASDELYIENAEIGTRVRLFNIVGQQVYSGYVANKKEILNIAWLPQGTYILELTDVNGNIGNSKLIKAQ